MLKRMVADSPRDVLAYLKFWDEILWREGLRADPAVGWQRDLSWDEIAAAVGAEAPPKLIPGEYVPNVDLANELYWPGRPPLPGQRAS